jgi:hypothetical protein
VHLWLLLLCLGASVWFLVWTHTGSEGNFPDWAAILWRLGADLVFAYFIIYVASYFLVALVIWSPRHCRHKKSRCDNYCRKCGRRMEPPETPSGSNPAVSARHI